MNHKLAILLCKLYKDNDNLLEWVLLNHYQFLTSQQSCFISINANKIKFGINNVANRLYVFSNFHQLTLACACVCMAENDEKHLKNKYVA